MSLSRGEDNEHSKGQQRGIARGKVYGLKFKGVGVSHFRPIDNEDTRGHFVDTLRLMERSRLGVCPIISTRIALTKFTKKRKAESR